MEPVKTLYQRGQLVVGMVRIHAAFGVGSRDTVPEMYGSSSDLTAIQSCIVTGVYASHEFVQ